MINVLACLLALGFASWASAADVRLRWTGHENATHYRIYRSLDGGTTWTQDDPDIPQPVPFPADAQVETIAQDVPETMLVLFRASALRDTAEKISHEKGAWYDHRLMPPSATGLGAP